MNIFQGFLHTIEEGKARILTLLIPMGVLLLVVLLYMDFKVFAGLNDPQSMDNAQLARQIVRGQGFTTKFIRPAALAQFSAMNGDKPELLFPVKQFPVGTDRVLPDTYNAPGYPYLLAAWFKATAPNFQQAAKDIAMTRGYQPDKRIPLLNQIFLLLTAGVIFVLALRLFDLRVAATAVAAFLLTNLVWQFSLSALATLPTMFLCTLALWAAVEIFQVGERHRDDSGAALWPAWPWTLLLGAAVSLACLFRLDLLVLIIPLAVFLGFAPSVSRLVIPLFVLLGVACAAPWLWHWFKLTGSWLGSNTPLLHYGTTNHDGNQIYCTLAPPNYEQLFKDISGKVFTGFGWNFSHGWQMLGSNPLVILFFASILHSFRQLKTQAFRWLIIGLGTVITLATSCGTPHPGVLDPWNGLVLLLPAMLVVGSAYLFILVDRMQLDLWILQIAIVVATLVLTGSTLVGAALDSSSNRPYPPYSPAALRAMGAYAHREEWITTDMPWAEAWYGDHTSVWLPDTLGDFELVYDNYNNSGLMVLTPVLLGLPASTFTSGEYKDWLPFISGAALPSNFPLNTRAPTGSGFIEYMIWGRATGG